MSDRPTPNWLYFDAEAPYNATEIIGYRPTRKCLHKIFCTTEFEPELVKKQQTSISGDIEEKILSMYAKGMTTSDIEAHIRDIYGLSVSDSTISRITDKILPLVKEWHKQRANLPLLQIVRIA